MLGRPFLVSNVQSNNGAFPQYSFSTSSKSICHSSFVREILFSNSIKRKTIPEFTTVFDLGAKHVATVSKDRTGIFDSEFFTLSELTGQKLRDWLENGYDVAERKKQIQELWQRYLMFYNGDQAQATEAVKAVISGPSLMNCTANDIQALISDIEQKEPLFA